MHKCIRENITQKCTNALASYESRQMHKCIQSITSSTGKNKCTNACNLRHHLIWGPPLQDRVGPKQMHKCIQSSTSSNRVGKCTNAFSLQHLSARKANAQMHSVFNTVSDLGPSLHNRAGPTSSLLL